MFVPEDMTEVINIAVFIGFVGIGFGALIGVSCRALMSVVNIFDKFTK